MAVEVHKGRISAESKSLEGRGFFFILPSREEGWMIEPDYLKDNTAFIEKLRQIPTLKVFDRSFKGRCS